MAKSEISFDPVDFGTAVGEQINKAESKLSRRIDALENQMNELVGDGFKSRDERLRKMVQRVRELERQLEISHD
ncbi:hypothetical protein W822_15630 [Advenella kashmirensis W13003]|uniref:Uncharacterized protein n=1 Tax=Advenella kashmirensis W13003 TaxID=1424334 RepID=V8QSV8_9BURK|nr:hypothetical protein [Advenella kashmirensis]ETF02428.1 hypothetical protein W822_15630 [Advenella kashmirensis W13003]